MKRSQSVKTRKRNLFADLSEGLNALADARRGKLTLRTHSIELVPTPHRHARKKLMTSDPN